MCLLVLRNQKYKYQNWVKQKNEEVKLDWLDFGRVVAAAHITWTTVNVQYFFENAHVLAFLGINEGKYQAKKI